MECVETPYVELECVARCSEWTDRVVLTSWSTRWKWRGPCVRRSHRASSISPDPARTARHHRAAAVGPSKGLPGAAMEPRREHWLWSTRGAEDSPKSSRPGTKRSGKCRWLQFFCKKKTFLYSCHILRFYADCQWGLGNTEFWWESDAELHSGWYLLQEALTNKRIIHLHVNILQGSRSRLILSTPLLITYKY